MGALQTGPTSAVDAAEVLGRLFRDALIPGLSAIAVPTFAAGSPDDGPSTSARFGQSARAPGFGRRASVDSHVRLGCFRRLFWPSGSVSRRQRALRNGHFCHQRTIDDRAACCPGRRRADRSGKYEQAHFPRRTPGSCEITPLRMTCTNPAHWNLQPKASAIDDPEQSNTNANKAVGRGRFRRALWVAARTFVSGGANQAPPQTCPHQYQ